MILNFNYKFNLYQYQLLFLLQITLKATAFLLSEKNITARIKSILRQSLNDITHFFNILKILIIKPLSKSQID